MNESLRSERIKLGLIIAVALAMALATFWLVEVLRQNAPTVARQGASTDPDYYVDKFNFVKISIGGQGRYNISGERMQHFPQDDHYLISQPRLRSLDSSRAPLTLRAERAVINDHDRRVHLYDEVRLDRAAAAGASAMHLESAYLLVLPDDEIMQTDRAVKIRVGAAQLNGTGMLLNNATRQFSLSGAVRGIFPPR